jgi:Asp-tRNA(Asn)/Glu-tRNA(Gln) amidotransferase C subunit
MNEAIPTVLREAVIDYLDKASAESMGRSALETLADTLLAICELFVNVDGLDTAGVAPVFVGADATVITLRQLPDRVEVLCAMNPEHSDNSRIGTIIRSVRALSSVAAVPQSSTIN